MPCFSLPAGLSTVLPRSGLWEGSVVVPVGLWLPGGCPVPALSKAPGWDTALSLLRERWFRTRLSGWHAWGLLLVFHALPAPEMPPGGPTATAPHHCTFSLSSPGLGSSGGRNGRPGTPSASQRRPRGWRGSWRLGRGPSSRGADRPCLTTEGLGGCVRNTAQTRLMVCSVRRL